MTPKNLIIRSVFLISVIGLFQITWATEETECSDLNPKNNNFIQTIPNEIQEKILNICENKYKFRLVSKSFCSLLDFRIISFKPNRLENCDMMIFAFFINKLPNITTLNLYGNQIGDIGKNALKNSQNLHFRKLRNL